MVSANFLLDFCWSVMNNQIASNRDLKIIAQKSQLSDKTKKMSLIVKRNRLSSAKCKRLAVRQFLSVEHRNHRLHFAQDHVNCHLHPIQRVLWRFWLDFNDGLRRIWREKMSNSTAAVLLSTTGLNKERISNQCTLQGWYPCTNCKTLFWRNLVTISFWWMKMQDPSVRKWVNQHLDEKKLR